MRHRAEVGTIARPVLFCVLAAALVISPMRIFTAGELMEIGLDWQVVLKLVVGAAAMMFAAWGMLTSPNTRRLMITVPSLLIMAVLALGVPAALSGFSKAALPGLVFNFAYLFFVAACVHYIRATGFLVAIVLGSFATASLSLLMYFLLPEYGVHEEFLGSVTIPRMSGMSHPNSVGRSASMGLLALLAVRKSGLLTMKTTLIVASILALALFFALSRTATVSLIVGIAFLYLDKVRSRNGMTLITLLGIIGLGSVFFLLISGAEGTVLDKVIGSVSKTGDAEELTSGTGRAVIWGEAIRLIQLKPLTGYGIGAAQELLLDFSQSPHNMFLHTTMISGVLGGALMVVLALYLVRVGFSGQYRAVAALAMFLLTSGMMEDTVLETFPGPGTLVLFLCCLHPKYLNPEHYAAHENVTLSGDEIPRTENTVVQ